MIQMQNRHAVERTRDCTFVMAYLYPNQCWATWREERNGHQALLELHQTRKEASERHNARVAFQRQVEASDADARADIERCAGLVQS